MAIQDGKAVPGQLFHPPPAALWNAILDVGRWWLDQRNLVKPQQILPQSENLVKLKNGSGAVLARGRVLQIGTNLITTPTNTHPWFNASTPSPNGADTFAVALRPMPSNAIDWCQVSGRVKCRLNVNHVQHPFADVDASTTLLQSKWHGRAKIVWKSTASTGEQDAEVLLGQDFRGPIKVIITAASGIAAGASGNAKVLWAGADASPASTITVKFGHMAVGTAGLNKDALVHWVPSEQLYEITELECP